VAAAFGGILLVFALQCPGEAQALAAPPAASQQPRQPDPPQQPASAAPSPSDAVPQPAPVKTPPSDIVQQPPASDLGSSNTVLHPLDATQTAAPAEQQADATAEAAPNDGKIGAITEDEVKRRLLNKTVYLRDGYLDNALTFDEHGKLIGHSPQGSYTLSLIEIDKVRLRKRTLELTGIRYGMHFLGARPDEDPTKAMDRVRITPKKKLVKIEIDRELVIVPKKKKPKKGAAGSAVPATTTASGTEQAKLLRDAAQTSPSTSNNAGKVAADTNSPASEASAPNDAGQAAAETKTAPAATGNEIDQAKANTSVTPAPIVAAPSDGGKPADVTKTASAPAASAASGPDQAKAPVNAKPTAEPRGDLAGVTTTTSPAHAARLMRGAIDRIFAERLDDRIIAGLPDFWKLYYQAVANRADYKPTDPSIYRQNAVDQKAKLLTALEPSSNEYAQRGGVAGMALYHAVIGADGKPQEIVVGRPIGFGLDESAADAIRKASFQPAMKDGKTVAVVLDLVVQFRIYSKRTGQAAKSEAEESNSGSKLPGPYSVTR
jgi:hypothetical protein